MPFIEQLSFDTTTIVITSLMVLASAGLLYSIGAFTRETRPNRKVVNNKAGNGGNIGRRPT